MKTSIFEARGSVRAIPWLLLGAVSVGAAAWFVAHRVRTEDAGWSADELLALCERSAEQLEARVTSDGAYAL